MRRGMSQGAWWFALPAGAFSIAVGLAVGDPASGMLLPVVLVLGIGVVGAIAARPFAGFLTLVFSLFLLVVVSSPEMHRSANAFDVVLVPLLAASFWGAARRVAAAEAAGASDPARLAIRNAARRFSNSAVLYLVLAAVSLGPMFLRLGFRPAVVSGLSLSRAAMGALVFPLAIWWLRDERRIETTLRAVFVAVVALALANGLWAVLFGVPRAGMVWWVTATRDAIGSPNEAATGLLVAWALMRARYAVRPGKWLVVPMGLVLVMLPLTQSRSGLLAFAVFLLLTTRGLRWRWVLGALAAFLLSLAVVPVSFWERMGHSLALQRGSFELFSFLIRVYSYHVAWHVFLDHPVIGVGYLGLRFVSVKYNEFHLLGLGAENYFLETLVGLGIVGLGVLGVLLWRLLDVGRVVKRVAAPGTFGGELARLNTPLLVALLAANLTADGLAGLAGVGQLALWAALLVRAGQLGVPRAAEA